jgi:hypothetical protein
MKIRYIEMLILDEEDEDASAHEFGARLVEVLEAASLKPSHVGIGSITSLEDYRKIVASMENESSPSLTQRLPS